MHVHACGDGAVRLTLDAFEAAIKANGPRNRRHTICHAFVGPLGHPALPRTRLGGQHANPVGRARPLRVAGSKDLGEERGNRQYTFKSFIDQGVTVSFGTDALATGYKVVYKPLEAIQSGHTRQEPGKPDGPVLAPASERLSVAELIRGYTINGAYQLRKENEIGSIRTGKLADLVVLEKNLFDVTAHDIGKVNVQLTMMNGRITHRGGI